MNLITSSITDIEFGDAKSNLKSLATKGDMVFYDQKKNIICFASEVALTNENVAVYSDKSKNQKVLEIKGSMPGPLEILSDEGESIGTVKSTGVKKNAWELTTNDGKKITVIEQKSALKQIYTFAGGILNIFSGGGFRSNVGPYDITCNNQKIGYISREKKKKGRFIRILLNVWSMGFTRLLGWTAGLADHKIENVENLNKEFDVRLLIGAIALQAFEDRRGG
jgi:hypothetical protein